MWMVIIGIIVILVAAWFARGLFVEEKEIVKVADAARILKREGYDEQKALDFLNSKDTDNDGSISLEEWEESQDDFDDWLKDNAPPDKS